MDYDAEQIWGSGLDKITISFNTEALLEEDVFTLVLSTEAENVTIQGNAYASKENGRYEVSNIQAGALDITFNYLEGKEFIIKAESENVVFAYDTSGEIQENEDETVGTASIEAVSMSLLVGMNTFDLEGAESTAVSINTNATNTVTVTLAGGETFDPNKAYPRDTEFTFKLDYDFNNTGTKPTVDNPVAYFDIPDSLVIKSNSTGDIVDGEGAVIGSYSIEGNRVTFNYKTTWLSGLGSNIDGYFVFNASVDSDAALNKDKVEIVFDGVSDSINITLEGGKVDAYKNVTSVNTDGTIDYSVTFTVTDKDVTNVKFTDTLGANLEFVSGSFVLDNNALGYDLVSGAETTFANMTVGTHVLKYKVRLKDTSDLSQDANANTISWNWAENTGDASADKTTNVYFQTESIGKGSWYDSDADKNRWSITVTPDQMSTVAGITVTDTLGSEYLSYDGSFGIYEYNESGSWTEENLKATITIPENADSFTYTFTETDELTFITGRKYAIVYYTTLAEGAPAGTYSNTARTDDGKETSSSYYYGGESSGDTGQTYDIVHKQDGVIYTDAEGNNKGITWTITIDPSKYTGDESISNLVISDYFTNSYDYDGFEMDKTSLSIADANGKTYVENTDYTVTWSEEPVRSFDIIFTGTFTNTSPKITITYNSLATKEVSLWVGNAVDSTYHIGDLEYTKDDNSTSFNFNNIVVEEITSVPVTKSGSMTGMIADWEVIINRYDDGWGTDGKYDLGTEDTYTLVDTLPSGMEYVAGSAEYVMTDYVGNGSEITGFQSIAPTVSNGKLTFLFTGAASKQILVRYKTKISGGISAGDSVTYTNTAEFLKDSTFLGSADADVTYTKKILDKAGALESTDVAYNRINYTIIVNADGADLMPDSDELVLVDTLDENASLVLNTVKVTDLEGNDVGHLVSYNLQGTQGQLTVTVPDEKALKVTYGVNVSGATGENISITNNAELKGVAESATAAQNTVKIVTSSAGAGASTNSIKIKKIDANSVTTNLAGAEFTLYKVETVGATEGTAVATATTNSSGLLTFEQESNGNSLSLDQLYYFVETQAPDGYVLDSAKHYFILKGNDYDTAIAAVDESIRDQVAGLSGGNTIPISNVKAETFSFIVIKADEADISIKLSGAEFKLEGITDTSYSRTVTTAADGSVQFTDLTAGQYTLSEVTAPAGYVKNDTVYKIKVTEDGEVIDVTTDANSTTVLENASLEVTNVIETIEISVHKVWDDADNQDGKRPTSVTVRLLADGSEVDSKAITADDNWTIIFENLPKYKNVNGIVTEIAYTLTEDAVTDYNSPVISKNNNSFTVTNSYTPDVTSRTVKKVWEDNNDSGDVRPESITVKLYAKVGSNPIAEYEIKLSDSNNWEHTWSSLSVNKAGIGIDYSVVESDVPTGYEVDYSTIEGNLIVTNTFTITPAATPTVITTPTPTATIKPTTTPKVTATPSAIPTATATPAVTPEATPNPTAAPTNTPAAWPSSTPENYQETGVTQGDDDTPSAGEENTPEEEESEPTVMKPARIQEKGVKGAVRGARRGLEYAVLGRRRRPSTGDSLVLLLWTLVLAVAVGGSMTSGIMLVYAPKSKRKRNSIV